MNSKVGSSSLDRLETVLFRLTGAHTHAELYGKPIPHLGTFLGLTLDKEEGIILWYFDYQGSTRTISSEDFFKLYI